MYETNKNTKIKHFKHIFHQSINKRLWLILRFMSLFHGCVLVYFHYCESGERNLTVRGWTTSAHSQSHHCSSDSSPAVFLPLRSFMAFTSVRDHSNNRVILWNWCLTEEDLYFLSDKNIQLWTNSWTQMNYPVLKKDVFI